MTKRISDLSFAQLKDEAAQAWSAAASLALDAGLKPAGIIRPLPTDEAEHRTPLLKAKKTRFHAA